MGSLGPAEIIVIVVVALIVFGPQRLPELARQAGRAIREFRRVTSDLTDELRRDLDEPAYYPVSPEPAVLPEQEVSPEQAELPAKAVDEYPPGKQPGES